MASVWAQLIVHSVGNVLIHVSQNCGSPVQNSTDLNLEEGFWNQDIFVYNAVFYAANRERSLGEVLLREVLVLVHGGG